MDYEPITIDEIIEKINLNIQDVSCALTMLEVQGLIQKCQDRNMQKFCRRMYNECEKYLVIVESPEKSKNIHGFLGSNYKVIATKGHVRTYLKVNLVLI